MKKYQGMRKLYFTVGSSNPELMNQWAMEFRRSPSSITPNFSVRSEQAFILYCDELMQKITKIYEVNAAVEAVSHHLPEAVRSRFLKQTLIEEILQSNEAEGVRSTRREIRDSMNSVASGHKGKRFDGMIRKYQMLPDHPQISLKSCHDVRKLYDEFILDEVLKEDPKDAPNGLYFRSGIVGVRNQHGKIIHEGIYPEKAINEAMESSLAFLNDEDYNPLIRLATFHFMFAYIHPFYNGNGRTSRFISSAKLLECGINRLAALRLSYVIKNRYNEYCHMFNDAEDRRNYGDLTLFVVSFLDFVLESCNQVLVFLQEKSASLAHYSRVVSDMGVSDDSKQILQALVQIYLCEDESIAASELSKESGISDYRIKKVMDEFTPYCVIERKGRSAYYQIDLEKLDAI